jgi:transcription initiation factor TFIID subunit 5
VQYSPVGHYFASASHDRTARVWCMERLHPLRILAGHLSDVDCVQWHVNCNYIATGSSDKTVRLWDVQTGECMRIFTGHRGMVLSLAMSSDGRYMASGDEDGAILMWDLGSGRCVTPLLGHTGCVWTLAFSGEGSLLASGSADNTVRLWDVNASGKTSRTEEKSSGKRRLRLLKTLPTKSTPVYALKFSRRNLLFAAGAFSPLKTSVTTG